MRTTTAGISPSRRSVPARRSILALRSKTVMPSRSAARAARRPATATPSAPTRFAQRSTIFCAPRRPSTARSRRSGTRSAWPWPWTRTSAGGRSRGKASGTSWGPCATGSTPPPPTPGTAKGPKKPPVARRRLPCRQCSRTRRGHASPTHPHTPRRQQQLQGTAHVSARTPPRPRRAGLPRTTARTSMSWNRTIRGTEPSADHTKKQRD
mmetsp:Transcript_52621/g.161966  ORF Transcript_52621/g.161966 Transcript_52621/m.161966 type:complete len:209 (-) Transcript_52621:238-864(-)